MHRLHDDCSGPSKDFAVREMRPSPALQLGRELRRHDEKHPVCGPRQVESLRSVPLAEHAEAAEVALLLVIAIVGTGDVGDFEACTSSVERGEDEIVVRRVIARAARGGVAHGDAGVMESTRWGTGRGYRDDASSRCPPSLALIVVAQPS